MSSPQKSILVADIGGTSSRFSTFLWSDAGLKQLASHWLKTGAYTSFDAQLDRLLIDGFISSFKEIDVFVIAGAGPVQEERRIKLTNAPWGIDLETIVDEHQPRRAVIVNDFVAQAFSAISPIEVECIIAGVVERYGTKVVIGAGTGLGQGAITWSRDRHALALPSEGGHTHYVAESEQEQEFAKFLTTKLGVSYPTWEDALSGRGLERTHEFLTGELLGAAEIGDSLEHYSSTADLFSQNLGRICRNLALQYLSTGGVYITGGVVAKNRVLVENPLFRKSFLATRQHQEFINDVAVYVIDNEESGLWGAAQLGAQLV